MEDRLYQKGSTTGKKALTKSQVEQLLGAITDLEDLALIKLAITSGMRRKDIVSLKKADIDIKNRRISFYEHKKRRIHSVYLDQDTMNTLEMWIKKSKGSEWLFPAHFKKSKGHMSSRTAYNILNKNLKKAGLPERPFHALRATCIKLYQKAGWTPEQVAELTGDTIRTIQQHYSTPSDEEMKKLVEEKPIL